MSRIPAALLYLTVYNPSIRLDTPVDDEDAEEQVQILFYTAKERAVSRDRMLRQIGLAKALVNFTDVFAVPGVSCQNVHSQTRRMTMVSPEPNYWIHACVELPKSPKPPPAKGKKKPDKDKAKEQDVIYDYHDGAIQDIALRAHLLRGYEQFKLTHGSFTSIMANLGQQALELQLERFFTVWAWMWDVEDPIDFGKHLGTPLHPFYKVLATHFDMLYPFIPPGAIPFLVSPPCFIPSTRFTELQTLSTLPRYLLSMIPSHQTADSTNAEKATSDSDTIKGSGNNSTTQPGTGDQNLSNFLAISSVNMPAMAMPSVNLNMDVRKWTWPGYLTFGKTAGKGAKQSKSVGDEKMPVVEPTPPEQPPQDADSKVNLSVEVDTQSLEEAMSSNGVIPSQEEPVQTIASPESEPALPSSIDTLQNSDSSDHEKPDDILDHPLLKEPDTEEDTTSVDEVEEAFPPSPVISRPASPEIVAEPLPILSRTFVHISEARSPLLTRKRRMFYLTKGDLTFALVDGFENCIDDDDLPALTETVIELIDNIVEVMSEEQRRSGTDTPITAVKILQPKDSYVFSLGDATLPSSGGFKSTSEHLFNGQQLLRSDSDILEVFSRGQNPQDWHVSRRGLGVTKDGSVATGEVYLESSRKESSLADVDNEIAGGIRRFMK